MATFCSIHGYDNPDCNCSPFVVSGPPGIPQSTTMTVVVGLSFEEMQLLGSLLYISGYEVTLRIEGEFRAPLQRYARKQVLILTTDAPVAKIMRFASFVLR